MFLNNIKLKWTDSFNSVSKILNILLEDMKCKLWSLWICWSKKMIALNEKMEKTKKLMKEN